MSTECPFCTILDGDPHDQIQAELHGCIVIEPLNPITPGHLLVIPWQHVRNATDDPRITATAMLAAAVIAQRYDSCNIITSVGSAATQTVEHLHIHVVPRHDNDGLRLPWTT